MFKMDVSVSDISIPKNAYSKMTLDQIYDYMSYDANVVISYKNSVFFEEEVAIVELYWYLCHWYETYQSGMVIPFEFSTIEHTEPILVFSKSGDGHWIMDSIWKHLDDPICMEENDFIDEVKNFLENLCSALES